ncbi:tripartite tricarboxylate transporter TctB family protein [Clostridium grantii]|uniref:Tripartite tricarboxylate transporter TctB family protein n=1 Tax=Clostridium grantii DSM 8605 TaxID=1121316 RepID=A0A1M5UA21_9CLOT|nr:tripartite tricarboxylate transporter TctB family protein [Clostridium grantii]SHH59844.1 Tripartite tricarboxylate transporter TctB family protein [Clostridium grantii DSM 8605]
MEKQTLRRADLVMSIVLLSIAVFVFVISLELMIRTLSLTNPANAIWYRSSGLVPMIVSVLLAICSVSLFFKAWNDGARFDFFTKEKIAYFFTCREFKVAISIIGWLAIYIFILLGPMEKIIYDALYNVDGISWIIPYYLPYILMTFIFLFVFMIVFSDRGKRKNWITSAIISLSVSLIVAYLFGDVAMIILP